MIRIKKAFRIDQYIASIFVWKLFKRGKLSDKFFIEYNRVTTRKIVMFRLSLQKTLHLSKLLLVQYYDY